MLGVGMEGLLIGSYQMPNIIMLGVGMEGLLIDSIIIKTFYCVALIFCPYNVF